MHDGILSVRCSNKIEKEKREHAKQHGMIRTEISGGEIAEEMEKERRAFQLQMCEVRDVVHLSASCSRLWSGDWGLFFISVSHQSEWHQNQEGGWLGAEPHQIFSCPVQVSYIFTKTIQKQLALWMLHGWNELPFPISLSIQFLPGWVKCCGES